MNGANTQQNHEIADYEIVCDTLQEQRDSQETQPQPTLVALTDIDDDEDTDDGGFFSPEKKGIKKGVLGGIAMMVIAAVWFFVGLSWGLIFFYPPVLFIIGLYGLLKGLFTGNLAGESKDSQSYESAESDSLSTI